MITCILNSLTDNIRDRKSEMNSIIGAPDPTFGSTPSDKTTWQLSLDAFGKTFERSLPMDDCSKYATLQYSFSVFFCPLIEKVR